MKTYILLGCLLGVSMTFGQGADTSDKSDKSDTVDPAEKLKQLSYAIGLNIGKTFKKDKFDPDVTSLTKGIQDALADKPAMTSARERLRASLPRAVAPNPTRPPSIGVMLSRWRSRM